MSNVSEQWLSIIDYEGLYSVSDQGRVRNDRTGKTLTHIGGQQCAPQLWQVSQCPLLRALHSGQVQSAASGMSKC